MSLEDRIREEFKEGLREGHLGVPMEYPDGIRPLGEFESEGQWIPSVDPPALASDNHDDEIVDAEIIE